MNHEIIETVDTQNIYGLVMSFADALTTIEMWEIKNRHLTYPFFEHAMFFHLQLTNPWMKNDLIL